MSYGFTKSSGLQAIYLIGKDPDYTSSTDIKFKYDRSSLPVDFGVTSTDDINFKLDTGSSYILMATVYAKHLSRYGDIAFNYSFYNNDTSQFVGCAGGMGLYDYRDPIPVYPRFASLLVHSSEISIGGYNLSIRLESYSDGALNQDSRSTLDFENDSNLSNMPMTVLPTLTILKTSN